MIPAMKHYRVAVTQYAEFFVVAPNKHQAEEIARKMEWDRHVVGTSVRVEETKTADTSRAARKVAR